MGLIGLEQQQILFLYDERRQIILLRPGLIRLWVTISMDLSFLEIHIQQIMWLRRIIIHTSIHVSTQIRWLVMRLFWWIHVSVIYSNLHFYWLWLISTWLCSRMLHYRTIYIRRWNDSLQNLYNSYFKYYIQIRTELFSLR